MLTQLIFDWAKKTPQKTALIHNDVPWSYQVFAHHIAVARGYFSRQGLVGPGYAVLAVQDLSFFWVLNLALRSLGLTTACVPNAAAIRALGLPKLRCIVTSPFETWPGLDELCAEMGIRPTVISPAGESPLDLDDPDSQHPPGGHILRTSGTTGEFKMVLMSPAMDAVFARRMAEVFEINPDSALCIFDFPAWTAVGYRWAAGPWIAGATVIIDQGRAAWQALLQPGITHAVVVPIKLAAILAAPEATFPRNDRMLLAVTAGSMTRNQIDQAKARITPQLCNWLGSTEASGIALTRMDTPEDYKWHRLIPGRVVEIVDEFDRPLPAGEIGRVRIGTEGGPTGYLHDDAVTRNFFRNGCFYPGDLAVIRSDGRMALQGRVTDVINAGGHKIAPAPIEDRLAERIGVSAVCLFSVPDDAGGETIHVVIESATPIDREALAAALAAELRGLERVRYYYASALARNEMGKVLRQKVRAQALGIQPQVPPLT